MALRSAVTQLPTEVRAWLDRELTRRSFSGYEELEALLAEKGYQIGKSSIHRYGQKLEQRIAAIQASAQAAQTLADSLGDDADALGQSLVGLLQHHLFEVILKIEESDADPKQLAALTRAVADLSRASISQKKWASSVKEKLTAKFEELERQTTGDKPTLDMATLQRIREEVYGIV